MITARTLVRFAFAGLFVNALAVACVVSDNNDDPDNTACDPGSFKSCVCGDGDDGTKKCNASGSGYAACDCTGAGGGGGEGNTPTAGTAGTAGTGTAGSISYGGQGGAAGESTGGVTSEGGAAGSGGAGGSGDDLCVEDPTDDCQTCVQVGCCDQWTACSEDAGDCQQQFFNIMACAQSERADHDITPAEVEACAEDEVAGGNAWSDGLLPTTKALMDCVGGGTDWENRVWNGDSCNSLCFVQE